MSTINSTSGNNAQGEEATFGIQRLFLRSTSLNAPGMPGIFRDKWDPKIDVSMDTSADKLDEDSYISSLKLTITGIQNEKDIFTLAVEFSGIFTIKGLEKEDLSRSLGILCPSILFPYLRANIDNLLTAASLPPIMMAPINFEAIFEEGLKKVKDQAAKVEGTIEKKPQ